MSEGLKTTIKQKWAYEDAMILGAALCAVLDQFCERIILAGSVRRGKRMVSDLEILYVPKFERRVNLKDFFEQSTVNLAEECIERMLSAGELTKRPNSLGHFTWGPLNKLSIHRETDMPVDLFSTSLEDWWVALVIRTGSKETNLELTNGARRLGRTLHAYGSGVEELATGKIIAAKSEADVFDLCGRPYKEPEDR